MEKQKKTDKPAKVNDSRKLVLAADFGDVYVRVRGEKILRPIKAKMTLREKMGHFYNLRDDYPITYEGYKFLNQAASINILSPQSVIVDGREQPNPHIDRDESNMVRSVWARKIGLGFSPAGILTAIDKTLFYNIYTYLVQSIQAKMKKKEWDKKASKYSDNLLHPNAAVLGVKDEKPEKDGSWIFLPTAPPLGLWINYEDPAIIECYDEHVQRQKFADRIAQTIIERNIYKDHPAIGISKAMPTEQNIKHAKKGEHEATVYVYGYRHEFEYPDIQKLLAQAERGDDVVDIQTEEIEEVPYEEEHEAMEEAEKTEPAKKEEAAKKEEKKTPAEMNSPEEDDDFPQGQGKLYEKEAGG